MDQLSLSEQKDLVNAVEQAIRLTHDDISPNEALEKVAKDRHLSPEMIRRAAEAFNKSKSVYVFKTAGEDKRAEPFDLADPAVVIQSIYSPEQKTASSFELPEGHFDDIDFEFADTVIEKTASGVSEKSRVFRREPSDDELKTLDRLTKQARREHEQICSRMQENLRMETQLHKQALEDTLDKVASYLKPLPESAVQKIAQFVVNGYPTTGKNLLTILAQKSRRDIPDLEKSANAVVFQTREPYLSIARIYEEAEKMAAAEAQLDMLEKKAAEPFVGSVAANTIANMLAGMGMDPSEMRDMMGSKKKSTRVEEDLDPEFYNRLKSHDAKRTFMLLSLYDPDLKPYGQKELMKAYNEAVQAVPEAYDKQHILKNLMLRNLQSSGVKDPFEMKQEGEISEMLRKKEQASEQKVLEEQRRLEEKKQEERPARSSVQVPGPESLVSVLGRGAEAQIKNLQDMRQTKPSGKPGAKPEKRPEAGAEDVRDRVDKDLKYVQRSMQGTPATVMDVRNALTAYHSQAPLSRKEREVLETVGFMSPPSPPPLPKSQP